MKVAALDLGSNTFLCLIAEVTESEIKKVYFDAVEVVRLGQELDKNKRFHRYALVRADDCLKRFSEIIRQHKVEKVLAMATAAARDAENQDELFNLGRKHHIPIEIIPGEKEAQITYQGAVSSLGDNNDNLMVLDIGGGSTEFIFGKGQKLLAGESHNIGCVRLTEKFIKSQPTSDEEIQNVITFVDEHIFKVKKLMPPDFILQKILAVAGTPTSLAAAEIGQFDVHKVEGFILSEPKLNEWLIKLQKATVEQKVELGIPSGRADVILIGVIILLRTLKIFGLQQISVSTRGVRYGVALEMGRRIYAN